MTEPEELPGLSAIAAHYDLILCDIWGVIHHGQPALPNAVRALQNFRKKNGAVILLTNAPVPKARVEATLKRVSCPTDVWDEIVTSGDATKFALEELLNATAPEKPIFHIGPHYDDVLLHGMPGEFIKNNDVISKARFVLNTGLRDYENEKPEDYRDLLKKCIDAGLPMLCANPDLVVKIGNQLVPCAGALAQIYEQEGGQVFLPGKPNHPIYALALSTDTRKQVADPTRILCIGDGLDTDILGAQKQKLDALFICEGIHQQALTANQDDVNSFDNACALIQEKKREVKYIMRSLKW